MTGRLDTARTRSTKARAPDTETRMSFSPCTTSRDAPPAAAGTPTRYPAAGVADGGHAEPEEPVDKERAERAGILRLQLGTAHDGGDEARQDAVPGRVDPAEAVGDAHRIAVGVWDLLAQQHGDPVPPHDRTHRRAGADLRQELVFRLLSTVQPSDIVVTCQKHARRTLSERQYTGGPASDHGGRRHQAKPGRRAESG